MGMQVCAGATLTCSFGLARSTLVVTPEKKVLRMTPTATIMDNVPVKNIPPFGMCVTQSNPAVAAATAAALGTPTPAPCVPVINAPWAPGSTTIMIGNQPALNDLSKLMCQWGGVIIITNPGNTSVQVP